MVLFFLFFESFRVVVSEEQEAGYQVGYEVPGGKNVLQRNVKCDCNGEGGCVFKMSCAVGVPVEPDAYIMSDGSDGVPRADSKVMGNRAALVARPSLGRCGVELVKVQFVVDVDPYEKTSRGLVVFGAVQVVNRESPCITCSCVNRRAVRYLRERGLLFSSF